MGFVSQLIERLYVTGDHPQLVEETQRFGDNLEDAWLGLENGAYLLLLAALVRVEPKRVILTAAHLLENVCDLMAPIGRETTQVLEAVQQWEKGELSHYDVYRSGWHAYSFIARMVPEELPPDKNEVADAAVWLSTLVRDMPPEHCSQSENEDDCWVSFAGMAWMCVTSLVNGLRHQEEPESAFLEAVQDPDVALEYFADLIRQDISSADVLSAARSSGVWPLG